jgi:hypothetical protein
MEGVGTIFARCAGGALEDDYELALAYAPRELDYTPLSEPLVNVRATLDAAAAAGVLSAAAAGALLDRALALPYKAITWNRLAAALPEPGRAVFEAWLPAGRVDLKRADALALLDAVAAALALPPPEPAAFALADTRYWRAAVEGFERGGALPPEDEAVLDELRLDPARYERALVRAYARRAAAGAAAAAEPDPDALSDLRLDLGLASARDYAAWLARVRADPGALAAAAAAEDRLLDALERAAPELAAAVLDALRINGRFEALEARAADKRHALAGRPEPVFRPEEISALVAELCARRNVGIGTDDSAQVAASLGLADARALHRLLARERAYLARAGARP